MLKWTRFNYDEWVRLGANADLRIYYKDDAEYNYEFVRPAEIIVCDLQGLFPLGIVIHITKNQDYLHQATFEGITKSGDYLEMLVEELKPTIKEYWIASYPVLANQVNCGRCVANPIYTSLKEAQLRTKGWQSVQLHKIEVQE